MSSPILCLQSYGLLMLQVEAAFQKVWELFSADDMEVLVDDALDISPAAALQHLQEGDLLQQMIQ